MPAWVRNVQAGQGPGSPGGSIPAPDGGGFSVRGLMSEDALPQWLREAGAGAPQPAQGYPAYGAPAAPPPGWGQPAGGYGPGFGQAAGNAGGAPNVYDESNLPEWLIQPGANGAPPQPYDAFPTVRQPAPNAAPQPPYNGPSMARPNAFPSIEQAGAYRAAPSGGLSGNSLLDANALPGWMRGDPSPAQGDPAAAYRDAGGMRGSSLIDDAALPAWLRNQPGASVAQPYSPAPPQPPQPPQPQQFQPQMPQPPAPSIANWIGGSAANDAMPAWLDQAYNDARIPPLQAPQSQAPSGAGWPPNGAPANGAPPLPGTLNANSLMEESALPAWLRAQGQGQGQGPAPSPSGMGRSPLSAAHGGTLADMHTARMPRPGPGRQAPHDPSRNGFAGEPEREPQRFSASDLIDPDLLPSFMQGEGGGMGAPGAAPPFGAPDGSNAARSRAPEQWDEPDGDQGPMRGQPSGRVPRGMPIPQDELPEWLQQPDLPPMQRGGPSSRRGDNGYDSRRVPVPRDWNDDRYDASQWADENGDQEVEPPDDYPPNPRSRDRRGYGRGRRPGRDDGGDEREWDRDRDGRSNGNGNGRRHERRGFFGR